MARRRNPRTGRFEGRRTGRPNPTPVRIRGVMRRYGPLVAFYTLDVLAARGVPRYALEGWDLGEDMERLSPDLTFDEALRRYIEENLDDGHWYTGISLDHRNWDQILPWVALQVKRTLEGKIPPSRRPAAQNLHGNVSPALEPLVRIWTKLATIRDWAAATSPDLMRLSINQVLHRQARWHAKLIREARAGATPARIIHRFLDTAITSGAWPRGMPTGWTVQDLRTKAELKSEGESMGHCVGVAGYWDRVRRREIFILSIRDPDGRPHVTLEVHPRFGGRLELVPDAGTVVQAKGPGNKLVKDKEMWRRIQELMRRFQLDLITTDLDWCRFREAKRWRSSR